MTSDALQHLGSHRGLILGRALLAGAVGLVPVPYVDDFLAGNVRSSLVRRLAELRAVDIDANAVHALATPHGSRLLHAAGLGAVVLGGARRLWRTVATSLVVVRRADEALQTFQLGTLFDHYCARHHVGLGLDGHKANVLRQAMDQAISHARGETFDRAFRRSLMHARSLAGRLRRRAVIEKIEAELDGPATAYVASLVGAFDVTWAPHKLAQLGAPKP